MQKHPLQQLDEHAALRRIVEGTSAQTGRPFFRALVHNLAQALSVTAAWVTEYDEPARRLRAMAFWLGDGFVDHYEYATRGTPCEPVVAERRLVHVPENVIRLYPGDNDLSRLGAVSYMGVPLLDAGEEHVLGHLAVLDTRPMPAEERALAIMRIFASRAAAELRRVRAEAELADRERRLSRLLDGAMDAVIECDAEGSITLMNRAGEQMFGLARHGWSGKAISDLLAPDAAERLRRLLERLEPRDPAARSAWLPGTLPARAAAGESFPVEGTAACYTTAGRPFYTLVLRNVRDREQAQRAIQALSAEREYLREQLNESGEPGELLGRSPALRRVRDQLGQVAPTDATVLIHGETGTGKELVARAVHAASGRREKPMVKLNCAAVPAALIESEFFGHEQGAFTGATQKRLGRFALADGGTIFLDEVGELPLELQAKLLRVLQEGEFDSVGSSATQRVDVRVIAATNRDLSQAVRDGSFREDLYYRLNVFPIYVPPLRERRGDVRLLASALAERTARRMGRRIAPLSEEALARLEACDWPGNVRELQNVIERAVITSRDGVLRFDGLASTPGAAGAGASGPPGRFDGVPHPDLAGGAAGRILTLSQMQEIERQNLLAALETCGWRVSGKDGAAARLGMPPSTLTSRMKALKVRRPARG